LTKTEGVESQKKSFTKDARPLACLSARSRQPDSRHFNPILTPIKPILTPINPIQADEMFEVYDVDGGGYLSLEELGDAVLNPQAF